MKILLCTSGFPPDFSGSGLRVKRLADRMVKKFGYTYDIICAGKKTTEEDNPGIQVWRWDTIRSTGLGFPFHLVQTYFKSRKYMKMYGDTIDVIHMNSFSWTNRIIAYMGLQKHKKIIMESTLEGDDDPKNLLDRGIRNRLFRKFTRHLLKQLDWIVVNSSDAVKGCIESGIDKNKVVKMGRPCDTDVFGKYSSKDVNSLRTRLKIPKKQTVLVTVGRIQDRKNQLFLLKALKKLSTPVQLLIIGPYDAKVPYFKEVEAFIKDNKLNVKILGRQDAVNEYLAASDVLVFASKREGFPNAIAEAMCSGLPAVTTDLGSVKDYIGKSEGRVIENSDDYGDKTVAEFARVLESVVGEKIKFKRDTIKKTGQRLFSADNIDKIYNRLYNN